MKPKECIGYIKTVLFPARRIDSYTRKEKKDALKLPENDGLNIEWPSGNLDVLSINEIIEASRIHSLREAVATYIIFESEILWRKYRPKDYELFENRTAQDIAINEGYYWAGRRVLRSSEYYNDREAVVGMQAKLATMTPSSTLDYTDCLNTFKGEMRGELESLRKDPTGVDTILRHLMKKEFIFGSIFQKRASEFQTKEDPEIIGLKRGLVRYVDIYKQAIQAGASHDRS